MKKKTLPQGMYANGGKVDKEEQIEKHISGKLNKKARFVMPEGKEEAMEMKNQPRKMADGGLHKAAMAMPGQGGHRMGREGSCESTGRAYRGNYGKK